MAEAREGRRVVTLDIDDVRSRAVSDETVRLAEELRILTLYARDGEHDDVPGTGHGEAWASLAEVCGALYGLSAAAWKSEADLPGTVRPTTPIPLVLLAGLCRGRIAKGLPVTYRQLGALGGIAAHSVRQIVARGELKSTGGAVVASEAARWLSGRNVAGF